MNLAKHQIPASGEACGPYKTAFKCFVLKRKVAYREHVCVLHGRAADSLRELSGWKIHSSGDKTNTNNDFPEDLECRDIVQKGIVCLVFSPLG